MRVPHAVVVLLLSACSPGPAVQGDAAVQEHEAPAELDPTGDVAAYLAAAGTSERVRRFYEARGHRLAWQRAPAEALIRSLARAETHGLDPDEYGAADLQVQLASALEGPTPARDRSALDVSLSEAFLAYAGHLLHGRIAPSDISRSWTMEPPRVDLSAVLEHALLTGSLEATLDDLAPSHPEYDQLRDALARYRQLSRDGGWTGIPDGPSLKEGEAVDPATLAALEARLDAEGYLDHAVPAPDTGDTADTAEPMPTYDARLVAAVEAFQRDHGLAADGVLGPATRAALNASVDDRIRTLELNLERWRWMPDDLGARHVRVNIPAFRLEAWEDGARALEMGVIVGKPHTRTPVFGDEIERVVFNPYWNVPSSILRDEMLGKIRRDPSYLARNGYEVVDGRGRRVSASVDLTSGDYRVRQRPGRGNALGTIKFLFPNQHAVYLHDTPTKHLFERSRRAYSHGCVRIEDPTGFAHWLLGDEEEWPADRIDQLRGGGSSRTVTLDEHVPVYLTYFTASVGDDGEIAFHADVYGADEDTERALEARR